MTQPSVREQPSQVVGKMLGPLITLLRVGRQTLLSDALHTPGNIGALVLDRRSRLAPLDGHRLDLHWEYRIAPALLKRTAADEHLG